MAVKSYKYLIVWQKAMDLVELIYNITKLFPKDERFALVDQLRRAAVSIPSNIAEGQARGSAAEFKHFLGIARGSLAEVETQLLIALRLNYLGSENLANIMIIHDQISKMLPSLIAKIQTN